MPVVYSLDFSKKGEMNDWLAEESECPHLPNNLLAFVLVVVVLVAVMDLIQRTLIIAIAILTLSP
jgi:hypothetical protein